MGNGHDMKYNNAALLIQMRAWCELHLGYHLIHRIRGRFADSTVRGRSFGLVIPTSLA